jgi:type I restriction-modification system DNA methylase subunit
MVRLSRANLYLHGFPNPVIHEYDTLTSEERWDERCDVILANPPFMTPKGGIRPHNRFSVKAKRSEVLFVDYMAEHLNPGGRAGIIVPEGIIFQSQNAYKALRKMLVENYLWAVVSLPAGVFNPYSGVKTSILFLDRNLARRTDNLPAGRCVHYLDIPKKTLKQENNQYNYHDTGSKADTCPDIMAGFWIQHTTTQPVLAGCVIPASQRYHGIH